MKAGAGAGAGEIETLFFRCDERVIDKWLHYLPVYEAAFAPVRAKGPVRLLEVGVGGGGSLDMWRGYFGPDATIFGIDVNPKCCDRVTPPNQVRIGSQADTAFLDTVLAEMGMPDIVIDDGSHVASHQIATFRHLFPKLKAGGLYLIEDLHTAYWDKFEGGLGRPGTAIELVKALIDDQHGWHHGAAGTYAAPGDIGGITIHDSIVVIERAARSRPEARRVGG